MNSLVVNQNDLMIAGDGPMSLPAHLQGVSTGVSDALRKGMFTGGNRIGLKNSRFRLIVSGIEEGIIEENYLDTILLNAAPAVSRVFYGGAYKQGENVPPTCYSADGIAPPLDIPQRQSDKCLTCPQNVKGSKIQDGNKYKACGFFRRLVLMLAGDVDDRRVFKLDAKSGSLWGDNTASAKNLNDYIKSLDSRGVDVGHVVTRMAFNLEASVPVLVFRPFRYITPEELNAVTALVTSDEVLRLAEVSYTTLDTSGEEPTTELPAAQTQQEAPQQAQQQTATPVAQTAQTPARPQTVQRPQPVQRPAPTVQRAAPVVEEVPQQTVQQTVQQVQRPQTAQPVQQAVQRTAPAAAPAVVEVAGNDELADILNDLD